jgi:hypothetical protein
VATEPTSPGTVPSQPSPPPEPSSPSSEPSPAPAPAEPEIQWSSIRDEAKSLGLDLSSHADDESALRYMVQSMNGIAAQQQRLKQLEQLLPYAQAYAQHGEAFRQFLASQQKGQKPAGPAKFWDPPEYDPSWLQMLERDPASNELKLRAGAPPDILPKYLAYDQYRRNFGDRLLSNPAETLAPLIQEIAGQVTHQYYQQNMGRYQESTAVQEFEREHGNWLYQRDANGRPVSDAMGNAIFTPEGQRFVAYANQAKQMGINDIGGRFGYARDMLSRDLVLAQQAAAGQPAGEAEKKKFIEAAAKRTANASGSTTAAKNGMSQNKEMPLIDRLRRNFKAGGVTDQDFGVPNAPEG